MTTSLNAPTTEFEKKDRCGGLDHRPRVLLGKMGLDGHDRGVKVIARALRDSGVHVIYSGLWQTPKSLAISARDEDCDVIAASMMSNSHLVLGPRLVESTRAVLGHPDTTVHAIFGSPDDMKFRSSMTLFAYADAGGGGPYRQALDTFCGGEEDAATLALLGVE